MKEVLMSKAGCNLDFLKASKNISQAAIAETAAAIASTGFCLLIETD